MQRSRPGLLLAALALPLFASAEIPRTGSGHPDFTGTYDVATLTPLERPETYGDKAYLSKEEADAIRDKRANDRALASAVSSPERAAPPPGGDGSAGAAGNVGILTWTLRQRPLFCIPIAVVTPDPQSPP